MRHVDVPEEVSSALAKELRASKQPGAGKQKLKYIPVVCVVSGRITRTTLVPAGAGRCRLQIDTAQRKAANADAGDVIRVELRLDVAPRTLPVPADLRAALKDHSKAAKAFRTFAPGARLQFIKWFDSAKAPETRRKRLDRAIDLLLERALLSRKRKERPH